MDSDHRPNPEERSSAPSGAAPSGAVSVGALVLAAGLAASVAGALGVHTWEVHDRRGHFDREATRRVSELSRRLGEQMEFLRSVVALYDSSEVVTRDEFGTFVAGGLERQPATLAVSWIRRVKAADRARLEAEARREEMLEDFRLTEIGAEGRRTLAADRPEHYALWYREGPEIGDVPLGSDHAADTVVLAALRRARDGGRLAVTDPLGEAGRNVLAVAPVYSGSPSSTPARRAALRGFVAAEIDVRELFREAWGGELPRGVAVDVVDELAQPGGRALLAGILPAPEGELVPHVLELEAGDRRWRVASTPDAAALAPRSLRPWGLFALGALLSLLLAWTVIATIARARIGRVVRHQADELERTGIELLRGEVRRERAEERSRHLEAQLRQVIDLVPHMIFARDVEGRFLLVNEAAAAAFGRTVDALEGGAAIEAPGPTAWLSRRFEEGRAALDLDQAVLVPVDTFVDASGGRRLLRTVAIPYTISGDEGRAMLCVAVDVTDRVHAEERNAQQGRVLSVLASGAPLESVLQTLSESIEELVPGMLCSILLCDPDGRRLRHCIAPGLPSFYNEAIDGLEIGPTAGSCGAAAFLAERVVAEDVTTHPNWTPYRDLAARAGLRACWSQPILASSGKVLGTLAMYYREPRRPGELELDAIGTAAQVAGIAIERFRAVEGSRVVEEQLHQIVDLIPHMIFAKSWDGRFLMVNRAVAEAYGRTVESLVGAHHADVHSERAEVERMLAEDREVMSTGRAKVIPNESFVDASGKRRILRTIRIPYSIRGHEQRAVLGVAMEVDG